MANGLRIVGMLRARGSVTVTEVAQELGVGKATAYRLLSTLVAEDYALRDPVRRRYHSGGAILLLGAAAHDDALRQRLREPMVGLAARTGETVKLLVLEGQHGRVLETVVSSRPLRVGASVGELQPANSTAGGKVLLAQESEELLRERFGGQLPARTSHTIVDWDDLAIELQKVRSRGYAVNLQEGTPGVNGLAVPMRTPDGEVVASLSLGAPAERLPRARHRDVLGQLFTAAAGIDLQALAERTGRSF